MYFYKLNSSFKGTIFKSSFEISLGLHPWFLLQYFGKSEIDENIFLVFRTPHQILVFYVAMADLQQMQCFEISFDKLFVLIEIIQTDEFVITVLHAYHGFIFQHYDIISKLIDKFGSDL